MSEHYEGLTEQEQHLAELFHITDQLTLTERVRLFQHLVDHLNREYHPGVFIPSESVYVSDHDLICAICGNMLVEPETICNRCDWFREG